MTIRNLHHLFAPQSIAVIGASERAQSVGATVVRNLLAGSFKGPLFAVNPKHNQVQGLPCHTSVAALQKKNHIRNRNLIFAGQHLNVGGAAKPAPKHPAHKPAPHKPAAHKPAAHKPAPKGTTWGSKAMSWAKSVLGLRVEIIKRRPGSTGFHVRPRVWVVERTFGWIVKHRRSVRAYESRPDHHEAVIHIAMIGVMSRRLART